MKTKTLYLGCLVISGCLWAALSYWRYSNDLAHLISAGGDNKFKGSRFDPREFEKVDRLSKLRESESFKNRLRSGSSADLSWPGLHSAQVSWTWLELLQGLHNEASYEGDFSWMFSKLNTVIRYSHPSERRFVNALGSFYYLIGKDHAGATLHFQEMVKRSPDVYHTWFWGGYHAVENLKSNLLASDCYARAAQIPGAPFYLAALSLRLKLGLGSGDMATKKEVLAQDLPKELIEKIKQVRPEWFRGN